MPLLRPDETSGSVPALLLLVLVLPVVVGLTAVLDVRARGPSQYPTVPLPDIDWLKKTRIEDFLERGVPDTGFPFSFQWNPGNFFKGPVSLDAPFADASSSCFTFGGSLANASKEKTAEETAKAKEPLTSWHRSRSSPTNSRINFLSTDKPLKSLGWIKPTVAGGAIYRWGGDDRDSRVTMDFLFPTLLGSSTSLFFESRAEYQDVCSHLMRSVDHRFDLGVGLGLRKEWHDRVMCGINGFWDTSRLHGDWYSSPGLGFELALYSLDRRWDLLLNVYRGGGIDLTTGFTVPICEDRLDMRVHIDKYRFFDGELILGWKGGVEISSPDRLLAVSYEYGKDSNMPEYHAIACSVTVPFRLENIFSGTNPFELPEPPLRETRYRKRSQSEGVKRAWRRPETVVEARNTPQGARWTTPGKLADTFGSSSKPMTKTCGTVRNDDDACRRSEDCKCEHAKTEDTNGALGSLALLLLERSGALSAIKALGATYLLGDYAYRNAFGPFELEPYEVDRIRQEMTERQRRR